MVLGPKGPGRVGRRQAQEPLPIIRWWFFLFPSVVIYSHLPNIFGQLGLHCLVMKVLANKKNVL